MRPLILAALISFAISSPTLAADQPRTDRPVESVQVVGDLLKSDTTEFAQKATDDGKAEVALARLALKNSQNPQVKEFANMMIRDHTAANEQLEKIIAAENIRLSNKPDDKVTDMEQKLATLKGADFDRAYAKHMVEDHQDAVDLFEDYSKDGENAKLKEFAAKTLPTLREHLAKAKMLEEKMGQT